jgi:hypothetical protein
MVKEDIYQILEFMKVILKMVNSTVKGHSLMSTIENMLENGKMV